MSILNGPSVSKMFTVAHLSRLLLVGKITFLVYGILYPKREYNLTLYWALEDPRINAILILSLPCSSDFGSASRNDPLFGSHRNF